MSERTVETVQIRDVSELLQTAQSITERILPAYARLQQSGTASAQELGTLLDRVNADSYASYAAQSAKLAQAAGLPRPGDRAENVSLKVARVGLLDNAYSYMGNQGRPTFNLQYEIRPLEFIERTAKILEARPYKSGQKSIILKKRIETMLVKYPALLAEAAGFYLSAGLSGQEKAQAVVTLTDLTMGGEFDKSIKELWAKTFEDVPSEATTEDFSGEEWFEKFKDDIQKSDAREMLSRFKKSLKPILENVATCEASRDNRWGAVEVDRFLNMLEIPHDSHAILSWAEESLDDLNRTLDEVARELYSGASSWQEAWRNLPIAEDMTKAEILLMYRETAGNIMKKMIEAGLIPQIPQGDTYTISWASPDITRYAPKGYMIRPGYHLTPKDVQLYLPDPVVLPAVYRDLLLNPEIFAAHEVAAHATQQYFIRTLPEFVSNVGPSIVLGLEGHAFSTELAAFEEGVIEQNLRNFFSILVGRQLRAARVVFALKYHLSGNHDLSGKSETQVREELTAEYAQVAGLSHEEAEADAARSMENPFWLMAYYLGAGGAEQYAALAEARGITRRDAMKGWVEQTGALLPAHFQAYLEGLVDDPGDPNQFTWLVSDRAAELWNKYKKDGSFS